MGWHKQILERMKRLSTLVYARGDLGGNIHNPSGKIDKLMSGIGYKAEVLESIDTEVKLERERMKAEEGWLAFLTHSFCGGASEPDIIEKFISHLRASSVFVITATTVPEAFELRPVAVVPYEKLEPLGDVTCDLADKLAQDLARILASKESKPLSEKTLDAEKALIKEWASQAIPPVIVTPLSQTAWLKKEVSGYGYIG